MLLTNKNLFKDTKVFAEDGYKLADLYLFSAATLTLVAIYSLNFLLFHTVAEIFSSIISFSIFITATNTYRVNNNNFFMCLGIGSLFVGMIDFLHALAYPGIGIFPETTINLATQPPIISGLIWSLTLLISNVFIKKPARSLPLIQVYIGFSIIFILSMSSIFYFKTFPICYIDGRGVTEFKKICEYMIIVIFAAAGIFLFRNRQALDNKLFLYLSTSLLLSPVTRLCLTLLVDDITTLSNVVAHIVKVISFLCIYKGIVQIGLQRPFNMLASKLNEVDASLKDEYTKRKRMEEILIGNDKCYELLIENNKDAIFVHSEGRFVYANQGAAKLTKSTSSEELLSMSFSDIIPSSHLGKATDLINEMYNNQDNMPSTEIAILDMNLELVDVEVECLYFVYKGKPAILSIFRDISSKKKIETLEKDIESTKEFIQAQSEFFANVSHELKTPLNVLLSAIQVLTLPSCNVEKKLNKYLWTMKQNCFRLVRLVNNLIDLSKVESGYLKLDLRNYNIVNIVEDITLSVADYVEKNNVELIFDTDNEEKIIALDADKIERIMLNLLSNSIKFTNPGDSILVTITDRSDNVLISVKDTGVGIPEDKLQSIFDRFAQVDKTLSRNHEGSGIGLALVKSLVNLHGGTISVNSTYGEGSEFIIELPVKVIEEEQLVESFTFQRNIENISIEFSDIYSTDDSLSG